MAVTTPLVVPLVVPAVDESAVVEMTNLPRAAAGPSIEEVVDVPGEGDGVTDGEVDVVGVTEGGGVTLGLGEGLELGGVDGLGELLGLGRVVGNGEADAVVGVLPPADPPPNEEAEDPDEPELEELAVLELELLDAFIVRLVVARAETSVKSACTVSAMMPLDTVEVRYVVVWEPPPPMRR
jgi:hypothetical protein